MEDLIVHIGYIHECPDVYKRGKFGYHIVHQGERTEKDFSYGIDENSLVEKLKELKTSNRGIKFVNGISKKVRDGWAPGISFRRLSDEDFSEISRMADIDRLSA